MQWHAGGQEVQAAVTQALVATQGARKPVNSGRGVRIQGGRVYDSQHGITCHWCVCVCVCTYEPFFGHFSLNHFWGQQETVPFCWPQSWRPTKLQKRIRNKNV